MLAMKKITIMAPAYNEEEVVGLFYDRVSAVINQLKGYEFEILFVNDGSTDRTIELVKALRENDSRVSLVDLSRNFGKETAMIAGFDFVQGDAVIIMDADLQDPPDLIPELISHWEDGYDDVYAKRRSRAGETWLKKWTSKKFYNSRGYWGLSFTR
jgi:glycosyltransferase involved in cell wall biosynthesis